MKHKKVGCPGRAWYPLPDLQPVSREKVASSGTTLHATAEMEDSWAVSFGMPSRAPDVWRADTERTRKHLPAEKVLSVSVVATPEPDWGLEEVAQDFAKCAKWALES